MKQYIANEITKTLETVQRLADDAEIASTLEQIAKTCCAALGDGKKILFAGNGGSAADAQHLAAELVGRFTVDRPGLAAIALTTDTSVLTALANDYGVDCVFARQVSAIGSPGDVLVAISTSGRSRNVLRGLEEARRKSIVTVGFTGPHSEDMASLCDYLICAPAQQTAKIQEAHIVLGHILCGLIEKEMFDV